jgi:hypothetical protein
MTAQEKKPALTHLIDIGVDEAFGDYDEYGSPQSRAIALLSGDKLKRIDLDFKGGLTLVKTGDAVHDLEEAFAEGIVKILAAGAQSGVSIIYVVDYPGELVFVYAIDDSDVALCALALKRKTGVCVDDFHLVTEITHSDVSFWEPSEPCPPSCEIALQPIPEILIFPHKLIG